MSRTDPEDLYDVGEVVELDFIGSVSIKPAGDRIHRQVWTLPPDEMRTFYSDQEREEIGPVVRIEGRSARIVDIDTDNWSYTLELVDQRIDGESVRIKVCHEYTRPLPALVQLALAIEC